jgi:ABC-type xylose transport system permease subunit
VSGKSLYDFTILGVILFMMGLGIYKDMNIPTLLMTLGGMLVFSQFYWYFMGWLDKKEAEK